MNTPDLELFLRKVARKALNLKEGQHWDHRISQNQADALAPMLDEMDRNARAYGWEIGRGREVVTNVEFSDDNPFKDPNWRDNMKEEKNG